MQFGRMTLRAHSYAVVERRFDKVALTRKTVLWRRSLLIESIDPATFSSGESLLLRVIVPSPLGSDVSNADRIA